MDLHRSHKAKANLWLTYMGIKYQQQDYKTKNKEPKQTGLLTVSSSFEYFGNSNSQTTLLTAYITRNTPQMSLEIILNIESLDIHIKRVGLTAYKRLENKLDSVGWCTGQTKSHLQYWAQDFTQSYIIRLTSPYMTK